MKRVQIQLRFPGDAERPRDAAATAAIDAAAARLAAAHDGEPGTWLRARRVRRTSKRGRTLP